MTALNAAPSLNTLRVLPGNRLEALSGDREGQHSIRINDQWRICFRWHEGNAYEMSKSQTTTKKLESPMTKEKMAPVHPGEILKEDFMVPMGISQYLLAKSIGVDPRRINALIHGKRAITADTALRLGRCFGIESEFWMNLQTHYDLEVQSDRLAGKLEQEVKIHSAA
jgi:addiction module HigA family antidote